MGCTSDTEIKESLNRNIKKEEEYLKINTNGKEEKKKKKIINLKN